MNLKGQVWIETVIYTVIGISLIALVLAFATPKVVVARERTIIEQSIQSMQLLDEKINTVISQGGGNVRTIDFSLKRGVLSIDTLNDSIELYIDRLREPYSEPDVWLSMGAVRFTSVKTQRAYGARLILRYPANLTMNGRDVAQAQTYTQAATPYHLYIANVNNTFIEISESSQR